MATLEQHISDLNEDFERSRKSEEAFRSGDRRHWYFIDEAYCPPCGRSDVARIRVYGERPSDPAKRSRFREVFDWCVL